mmetsp:Transcript_46970/g.102173  ORF Transcript_46970/g.102173 Transcript_46970/m.102173 type:complete len:845 (-) Transcript_46970:203-2737(-)
MATGIRHAPADAVLGGDALTGKSLSVNAPEFVPHSLRVSGPKETSFFMNHCSALNMDEYSSEEEKSSCAVHREADSLRVSSRGAGKNILEKVKNSDIPEARAAESTEPAAEPTPQGGVEAAEGAATLTRLTRSAPWRDARPAADAGKAPAVRRRPWRREDQPTASGSLAAQSSSEGKPRRPWQREAAPLAPAGNEEWPRPASSGTGVRSRPWRAASSTKPCPDQAQVAEAAKAEENGVACVAGEAEAEANDKAKAKASSYDPELSTSSSEPEAEGSGQDEPSTAALDGSSEDQLSDAEGASSCFDVQQLLHWRMAAGDVRDARAVHCAAQVVEQPTLEPAAAPAPSSSQRQQRLSGDSLELEWRRRETRVDEAAPAVRTECPPVRPSTRLQVSETSWAAQMRARRSTRGDAGDAGGDEEVTRKIKGILNKLTVEKFPTLSEQLMECGIQTSTHVEILIKEVFEKATMQHHFIEMYADLCELLHEYFVKCPVTEDPKFSFKRLLLNECQASFERNLVPPPGISELEPEDRTIAEVLYKTRMLGNIRFVGGLLARKMLASKVLVAIMEELLGDPSAEALESLAALLTACGATFDTPEWVHRVALTACFHRIRNIVTQRTCEPRVRCLLKDVLELRAGGWEDNKPKRAEGPMTLQEVAEKASGQDCPTPSSRGTRTPKAVPVATGQRPAFPVPPPRQRVEAVAAKVPAQPYDEEQFRAESSKALLELRVSHDVREAALRLAGEPRPPAARQADEFCRLLAEIAQESRQGVRCSGFQAVALLFVDKHWQGSAAVGGLRMFKEEVCEDLRCDVPALPSIIREEILPALATLVSNGVFQAEQLNSLLLGL